MVAVATDHARVSDLADGAFAMPDVINFMCFQAFLLYTHYMRENVSRIARSILDSADPSTRVLSGKFHKQRACTDKCFHTGRTQIIRSS